MKIRNLFISAAAGFSLAVAGNALAQEEAYEAPADGYQAQGESIPAAPVAEISDDELGQFVEAQNVIGGIQQDFSARLAGVEDPEQAQALQNEANEAMVSAVEEVGFSVDRYNEVAIAIQQNPELQQRLSEMLGQ